MRRSRTRWPASLRESRPIGVSPAKRATTSGAAARPNAQSRVELAVSEDVRVEVSLIEEEDAHAGGRYTGEPAGAPVGWWRGSRIEPRD